MIQRLLFFYNVFINNTIINQMPIGGLNFNDGEGRGRFGNIMINNLFAAGDFAKGHEGIETLQHLTYFSAWQNAQTDDYIPIMMREPERVEKEIAALRAETDIPPGMPEREYLYRLWVYRIAKEHGGLVIYPPPNWNIGKCRWHVGPRLAMAILENGLCDAFEIMGGGNAEENNLQTALYYEAVSRGVRLPVVGSTDNHSILGHFDRASTYVFAEDGNITAAVLAGYSVAAEHLPGEAVRFYGPYRLVRYARFLADYYFPLHNELCASAGQVLIDYIQGDRSVRVMLEGLEQHISDFEHRFFHARGMKSDISQTMKQTIPYITI